MNPLTQLQSGLIVPVQPEPPEPIVHGVVKDAAMRKEIRDGLMMLVRALRLNYGSAIVLPDAPDAVSRDCIEHQIRAIGTLCLGGFDWEVKT